MNKTSAKIGRCLNELLVIHALRPDRVLASSHRLVAAAFGEGFMQQDKVVSLREIVENEVNIIYCGSICMYSLSLSDD